jgi:hypothetical protein
VVDPRSNLCYFNCGRVDKITTKGPLHNEALMVGNPFLYPDGIPLPISVLESCQADGSLFRTQILIFKSQPKGLPLLPHGEVTYFFEVPLYALD